jgi:HK97 family phage major capsid protein
MKNRSRMISVVVGVLLAAAFCVGAHAGAFDLAAHAAPFALDSSHSLIGLAAMGSIEQLRKLTGARAGKLDAMQAITTAAAASEAGSMTPDQRTQFDTLKTEIEGLDGDITRVKAAMETKRGVELPAGARIETKDNLRDSPTHGFQSFGEFAHCVLRAGLDGGAADPRLVFGAGGLPGVNAASTAPTNFANEGNGADGGYQVPPEYSSKVVQTAYNQNDSFLPMTDNTPVTGNGMTFNVDETTPWGTSGIKAYWGDEGSAGTDSKTKLDPAQLRLKKLVALVPITEEMMADAAALGAYVQGKVPEAISFKTNEALWEGNGAGKPKGFFNATGLRVTVAAEGGQAADSIVALNVSKMRARMAARSFKRAIWMINNDCLPQLDALAYATTATNTPIYKPEGGKYGYGTLLGKDVMVTDFNATVGDLGDIALVDWGMYRTITKAGSGVETATSMHFWFDRGITAFRTTFRIDGQPAIQAPVTPNKGASTLSPLVILAAR